MQASASPKRASGGPSAAGADLPPTIEAVLLSVDRPVPHERLARAIGLLPPAESAADKLAEAASEIDRFVRDLNDQYERTGRAFRIESVAGGLRLMTLPRFAEAVATFHAQRTSSKLSRAALETLAIVAYRQPVTRAEIEAIRGVACGDVLRALLERKLVTITGRAEELGRPMLYGTTRQFLDAFGLASIKDLPSVAELSLSE